MDDSISCGAVLEIFWTYGKVLMRNLCWQADSFGHVFIACFFNESYHLPRYYRPLQAMLEREVRLICLDLVL